MLFQRKNLCIEESGAPFKSQRTREKVSEDWTCDLKIRLKEGRIKHISAITYIMVVNRNVISRHPRLRSGGRRSRRVEAAVRHDVLRCQQNRPW